MIKILIWNSVPGLGNEPLAGARSDRPRNWPDKSGAGQYRGFVCQFAPDTVGNYSSGSIGRWVN